MEHNGTSDALAEHKTGRRFTVRRTMLGQARASLPGWDSPPSSPSHRPNFRHTLLVNSDQEETLRRCHVVYQRLGAEKLDMLRSRFKAAAFGGTRGAQINELFNKIDRDVSGSLDQEAFQRVLRTKLNISIDDMSDNEVTAIWTALDEDNSGNVESEKVLRFLDPPVQDQEGDKNDTHETVCDAADADIDAEFMGRVRAQLRAAAYDEKEGVNVTQLFLKLDSDGTGILNYDKVRLAFRKLLRLRAKEASDGQLLALCHALDEECSGEVQVCEIVALLDCDPAPEARLLRPTGSGSYDGASVSSYPGSDFTSKHSHSTARDEQEATQDVGQPKDEGASFWAEEQAAQQLQVRVQTFAEKDVAAQGTSHDGTQRASLMQRELCQLEDAAAHSVESELQSRALAEAALEETQRLQEELAHRCKMFEESQEHLRITRNECEHLNLQCAGLSEKEEELSQTEKQLSDSFASWEKKKQERLDCLLRSREEDACKREYMLEEVNHTQREAYRNECLQTLIELRQSERKLSNALVVEKTTQESASCAFRIRDEEAFKHRESLEELQRLREEHNALSEHCILLSSKEEEECAIVNVIRIESHHKDLKLEQFRDRLESMTENIKEYELRCAILEREKVNGQELISDNSSGGIRALKEEHQVLTNRREVLSSKEFDESANIESIRAENRHKNLELGQFRTQSTMLKNFTARTSPVRQEVHEAIEREYEPIDELQEVKVECEQLKDRYSKLEVLEAKSSSSCEKYRFEYQEKDCMLKTIVLDAPSEIQEKMRRMCENSEQLAQQLSEESRIAKRAMRELQAVRQSHLFRSRDMQVPRKSSEASIYVALSDEEDQGDPEETNQILPPALVLESESGIARRAKRTSIAEDYDALDTPRNNQDPATNSPLFRTPSPKAASSPRSMPRPSVVRFVDDEEREQDAKHGQPVKDANKDEQASPSKFQFPPTNADLSGLRTQTYLVDNSTLRSSHRGLGYRYSKMLDDKDNTKTATWGAKVQGIDAGDGWLRLPGRFVSHDRYLPMFMHGKRVLTILNVNNTRSSMPSFVGLPHNSGEAAPEEMLDAFVERRFSSPARSNAVSGPVQRHARRSTLMSSTVAAQREAAPLAASERSSDTEGTGGDDDETTSAPQPQTPESEFGDQFLCGPTRFVPMRMVQWRRQIGRNRDGTKDGVK